MDAALAYGQAQLATPSPAKLSATTRAGTAAQGIQAAARKTAKEFESQFLNTMMDQMFTGIDSKPPFGGGSAEKIYRSLLVGEFSKNLAAKGGIGIADFVYSELLKAQEASKV
ncbi:MAG: rod-binding protein [Hyphomicrobiales bacterium]